MPSRGSERTHSPILSPRFRAISKVWPLLVSFLPNNRPGCHWCFDVHPVEGVGGLVLCQVHNYTIMRAVLSRTVPN